MCSTPGKAWRVVELPAPQPRGAPDAALRGPDFLCIGALKCGTTWLYRNLRAHPLVWLPPLKELNYFNIHHPTPFFDAAGQPATLRRRTAAEAPRLRAAAGMTAARKRRDLASLAEIAAEPVDDAWYLRLFARRLPRQVAGDISPHYALLGADGIRHALALNPALKAIALLRDPAERTLSHMLMHLGPEADEPGLRRLMEGRLWPQYAEHSDYAAWLGRWRALLGPDALAVETLPRIDSEPERVLGRLCRFLGLPGRATLFPAAHARVNAGRGDRDAFRHLLPELRARLAPAYAALERDWPEAASRLAGPV